MALISGLWARNGLLELVGGRAVRDQLPAGLHQAPGGRSAPRAGGVGLSPQPRGFQGSSGF